MISVKLPDGSTAQFPDGTSRETMTAAIQQKFAPQGHGAPGSRAYADWAAQQARAGQPLPQVSQVLQQAPDMGQQVMNSIGATANGIVNGIPVLGPLAQGATDMLGGGISQLTGGNYGDYIKRQQALRQQYAQQAPVASVLGNVGGAMASLGGLGAIPAGAEALGITGAKTLPRMVNGLLSTEAIGTADNMARGQKPTDAALNAVLPAVAGGAGGPLIGKAVESAGGAISNAMRGGMQNRLTSAATQGAPDAAALKSVGSQLFTQAFGKPNAIPAVSDTAMMRLVGDVRNEVADYRPNEHTAPKAVGLMQHLMELANAANTPGKVVDIKDLHILRQTAGDILATNSVDQTSKAIARKTIDTLDNFIKTLKPADILGGNDPRGTANALMKGISTWSTASKVGMVESAIEAADTYKSGYENGLKLSFLNLMKQPEYQRFTPMEKEAIRQVAKGTTAQNIAELFGKLGVAFSGGAAHNILGGGIGTMGLSTALAPVLGPLSLPAAFGATTAAGIAGRHVAENIASSGANRAARIVATPNIPMAPQVPNYLAGLSKPLEIMVRGGAQGLTR